MHYLVPNNTTWNIHILVKICHNTKWEMELRPKDTTLKIIS